MAQEKVPEFLGGVPPGGTTGQVLEKASNTDNDTAWATDDTGGGGGGSSTLLHGGCFLQRVDNTNIRLIPHGHGKLTIPGNSFPSSAVTLTVPDTFVNLTVSGLASGSIYLVFAYNNSGSLALEVKNASSLNEDYIRNTPASGSTYDARIAIRRYYTGSQWNTDWTRVLVGAFVTGSGGVVSANAFNQLNFRSYYNELNSSATSNSYNLYAATTSSLSLAQSSSLTSISDLEIQAITFNFEDFAYQNLEITAYPTSSSSSFKRIGVRCTRHPLSTTASTAKTVYALTTLGMPVSATSHLNDFTFGYAGISIAQTIFRAEANAPEAGMTLLDRSHRVLITNNRVFMGT